MSVTPSQTVGPYFRIGLISDALDQESHAQLTTGDGERIHIRGVLLDGAAAPIVDGMLEIWDARRRAFGRFATHPTTGEFSFETLLPRAVPQPDGTPQAAHLAVGVFARGLLKRLYTRIYLADNPANETDPILALVPHARRATLLAVPTDEARQHFRFDIRLSGAGETVFFDC